MRNQLKTPYAEAKYELSEDNDARRAATITK